MLKPDFSYFITDEKTNYFKSQTANVHSEGTADVSEEEAFDTILKSKFKGKIFRKAKIDKGYDKSSNKKCLDMVKI